MEGKKKYIAIVLFLLIGLSLFTFANPKDDKKKLNDDDKNSEEVEDNDSENEKEEEKEDSTDKEDGTIVEDNSNKGNNATAKPDNGYAKALKAVEVAENTLSSVDSDSARKLVKLVTDKKLKQKLASRLDAVDAAIDATELVEALEKLVNDSLNKDDLNNAVSYRDNNSLGKVIEDLTIATVKSELQTKMDALNKILNDVTAPTISGVEDGEITNENVSITVLEEDVTITVTLNGTEIENAATFIEEGKYVYTVVDAAFNETVVTFTIDTTNPEFVGLESGSHYNEITLNVNDATDVTITVENKDTLVVEEVAVGTVLTEDATYYITATDAAGNSTSVWVAIDTTNPVISGVDETTPTNKNEIVYVNDKFLMTVIINGTEFTRADFTVGPNGENFSFNKKITHEGTHTVVAKDKFGNTTTVTFVIDKTSPEVVSVVKSNNDKATKEDVTVTVTLNEKCVAPEGWTQVSDTEFTKIYSENGKYTVEFSDVAGNVVETKFEVKRIDKVAPEAVVTTSNNGNPTNKDVTVTIVTNEAVYRPGDWTEVKTNKEHEWTKVYTENGTYSVVIKDKAGNETTVEFTVEGIDKEAPVYSSLRVIGGNLYKENGKYIRYATNGSIVYVYTTFAEKLAVVPTVTMNGTWAIDSYLAKEEEGSYIYASAFKLNSEDGLKDGEVSIVVEGYADAAGNVGAMLSNDDITLDSQKYVVIDKTPVKVSLSNGTIGSDPYSNLDVKLYDANKVVSVVINGKKLSHTGTYVDINDGDAYTFLEGENVIVAKDKAGNVTEVTYVKDITAPVAKSMAMSGGNLYKENGKVMWYVTNGGYIYVNLHFEEKLAVAPVVKLNGTVEAKLGAVKETESVIIYSYSYKLNENDGLKNGEVSVEVSGYADRAGNVGKTLTNEDITLASQKYVVIDKTPVKVTLSEGTIGSNPYSKLNVKLYDANGVASVVINETKLSHKGYYVDVNDGHAYTFLEGENVIVAKDKAGNVTIVTYVKDVTAPEIVLAGQDGLNKNEYRVEAGTKVSVKDIMATATDNYDNDVEVEIIKADFLATSEHPERNVYGYDFSKGFATTTVGRYNITYKATDDAGNTSTKVMLLVIKDTTAPVITIKGTEGRNNNELRVNEDTVVTLDDVTATLTDIVDGIKEIYPTSVTRFYPAETGKASHKYDASEGFDTSMPGYYAIKYEAKDEAGNKAESKTMLLVVKVSKAPEVINGEANLYGNLTLTDAPLYNVNDNTEEVVFNGNGYTFTQKISSVDSFQWSENFTRPVMSNLFSSSNGSKITINDLTLKGTTSSLMLGHYKNSTYNNYNSVMNNVNMIGLEVVSFSSGIAPAVTVYGNAILNNTNIYGTKLSSLDTDPMWPVWDLAVVNYSSTTINGGKIGSVYTWAKAYMEFNDVEVDTIVTACRKTSDFANGGLVIGEGTTVNNIVINNASAIITIKSGAVVETLDYNNIADTKMTVVIEDGATVKNIINKG